MAGALPRANDVVGPVGLPQHSKLCNVYLDGDSLRTLPQYNSTVAIDSKTTALKPNCLFLYTGCQCCHYVVASLQRLTHVLSNC